MTLGGVMETTSIETVKGRGADLGTFAYVPWTLLNACAEGHSYIAMYLVMTYGN